MLLRLSDKPAIDNLRGYPQYIVERLRALLDNGVIAQEDLRRKSFYDLTDGERFFFVHISPVTGRVWLLATWMAEPAQQAASYAPRVSASMSSASGAGTCCAHPS